MKMTEIIKDAFQFPSKNTGRFAMYLLLEVLLAGFLFGGVFTYAQGFLNAENFLIGGIYVIIAFLFGIIIMGYNINVIKSGINREDNLPVFELYENFMTGFDNFALLIAYYIIPVLIVLIVAQDTHLFSNAMVILREVVLQLFNIYIMGSSVGIAVNALSPLLTSFVNSLAITIAVALVLFIIFSILYFMAESRLANTGSLREALNMFESAKDVVRIGVGRVIALILVVLLIIAVIDIILLTVLSFYPFLLSILDIIITPYMFLVTQRALGLLYSDIA